ncbi:MAG: hypothetical protein ACXVCY_04130 [Pseudobdellovibrionaceae bacterium]
MKDILGDGSIIQDGMHFKERPEHPGEAVDLIPYPVSGYVIAVYGLDSEFNPFGDAIVCDVHVALLGTDLFRVPVMLQKAGTDNYISHQPTAFTANIDKSEFRKGQVDPEIGNGDTVLIQFINASFKNPIITGTLPHHFSGEGGKSPSPRENEDAGDHYKVRFNGTNMMIDKDGNFSIKSTKALDENIPLGKKFSVLLETPDKTQKVTLEVDNSADNPKTSLIVTSEDGKVQSAVFDGKNKTLSLSNQLDGGENSVSMCSSGVTVAAKAAANINAQDTTINAQGSATVKASGQAKVSGDGGTEVGSGSSITDVKGTLVQLAGGGVGVAKIGSQVLVTGNLGAPAIGYVVQGSTKVMTS